MRCCCDDQPAFVFGLLGRGGVFGGEASGSNGAREFYAVVLVSVENARCKEENENDHCHNFLPKNLVRIFLRQGGRQMALAVRFGSQSARPYRCQLSI